MSDVPLSSTRAAVLVGLILGAFSCTSVTTVQISPSAGTRSPSPVARPSPLLINSAPLHAGEVGVVYEPVALVAGGGIPPYRWTVSVGALPGGLTLAQDGTVSGTPTAGGVFAFSVQVFDANGTTAGEPVSVQIAPALTAELVPACATACSVEQGCDTVCGAFGTQSGGTPPYTYKIVSGFVPGGMTLDGLSLAGSFPTVAKFWQFTASVTDTYGLTAVVTPTFYVFPHLSLSGAPTCLGGFNPPPCTASLQYSGGTPGGTPQLTVISLVAYCQSPTNCPSPIPAGLPAEAKLTIANGTITLTYPEHCGGQLGSYGCPNGYNAKLTLGLTDQSICAAGTQCSSDPATIDIQIGSG